MAKISSTVKINGELLTLTWIPDHEVEKYSPVGQVYGVCFNNQGQILIIKDQQWSLPGGTPEKGESLEQTLRRELWEEANVVLGRVWPSGAQKVEYPNNPGSKQRESFYQLRYIGEIEKVEPLTKDPATGIIFQRKFVDPEEITSFIRWGELGEELFRDAVNYYRQVINV